MKRVERRNDHPELDVVFPSNYPHVLMLLNYSDYTVTKYIN